MIARAAVRRLAGVLALVAPLLGLAAPAAHAATKDCSAATPLAQLPTLVPGDTGTCVAYAETLLQSAAFYSGAIDGTYSTSVAAATTAVQQAYRTLRRDGTVTPSTWSVLERIDAPFDKWTCGNASSDKVLLVFDDYPLSTAGYTALIDAAKAGNYGIGVAPNGMYVRSGLVDVTAARARGLLVVDHTYDHIDLTTLTPSQVAWEITQPYVGSNYVRPPYGAENATVDAVLAQYHKNDCLWDVDPRDWAREGHRVPLEVPDLRTTPQAAADYIVANAWGGSTVVVHMDHLGTDPTRLAYIDAGLRARGLMLCRNWGTATHGTMPNQYCL